MPGRPKVSLIAPLIVVAITSTHIVASDSPRFFARSGDEIVLSGVEELRFYRIVIQPSMPETFIMPPVRAPLVLKGYDASGREVAQFVLYPKEGNAPGGRRFEPIPVKCLDAPVWFEQWADATGRVETTTNRRAHPKLLVIGKDAAGDRPESVITLMKKHRVDGALVLEAKWHGPPGAVPYSLELETLSGPFAEKLELLGDLSPIIFSSRRQPTTALVNRRPCLSVKGYPPLLEELLIDREKRVLASYLPWPQQLGRSERADAVFYSILAQAARVASEPIEDFPDSDATLQWPRRRDVIESERPILHALLSQKHREEKTLHLVDLRGKPIQRAKRLPLLGALRHRPLLILGTDPMLGPEDYGAPDVVWIEDDRLPPDEVSRYRLMEKLTESGLRF